MSLIRLVVVTASYVCLLIEERETESRDSISKDDVELCWLRKFGERGYRDRDRETHKDL